MKTSELAAYFRSIWFPCKILTILLAVSVMLIIGKLFESYKLYWYAESIWLGDYYRGFAKVRTEVNIPITAAENEYTAMALQNLIENRSVDFLQPSVYKIGVILQEKKVFTLAEGSDCKVMPHCISFGPVMATMVHICFSEPGSELVETGVYIPEPRCLGAWIKKRCPRKQP